MPALERTPRVVQTSTLTDEIYLIRRHLRRLGVALTVVSVWLGASLVLCSIHPELSTIHTHPLGAVSEWISSGLLSHLGLVSFSICLVIARLGFMLTRLEIPIVTSFDVASYAIINVVCTFPLAVFFKGCTLFGAPYGGAIGERFLYLFQGVSSPYLELCSTVMLLSSMILYLHFSGDYGASRTLTSSSSSSGGGAGGGKSRDRHEAASEHREETEGQVFIDQVSRSSLELLKARNVKSAPADIIARLSEGLSLEDDRYDSDIYGLDEPVDEHMFTLPKQESHEPQETPIRAQNNDHSFVLSSPIYSADLAPVNSSLSRLTSTSSNEPSIYQAHALHTGSMGGGKQSNDFTRRSSDSLSTPILRDPYREPVREPSHSDFTSPLVAESKTSPQADLTHRKSFIKRALDQLGVEMKSLHAEIGDVTSSFTVTLANLPPREQMSHFTAQLNERLNMLVKKSYGRTEPVLLVLPLLSNASPQGDIQVTWPHRIPQFTSNKRGIEENRARRRSGDQLMLYMGDLPNGCDVYLPFKNIPSLLITGGEQTQAHLGLNLLVMSLIYQAREDELRFLVADPSVARRPKRNPLDAHPQLFAPVLYQNTQVGHAINWLLSELNARSYLMKQARLRSFEELKERSKEGIHRLVFVVSELNQLNDEVLMLLAQLIDRLERSSFDVGMHLLINTRGKPQTQLTQRVLKGCTRRISLAASQSEAGRLGCEGAVNLVPQHQDMILNIGTGPVRIHGWLLSSRAYETFLQTFSETHQANYICSDGRFDRLPVPALKSKVRAQSSKPVMNLSGVESQPVSRRSEVVR